MSREASELSVAPRGIGERVLQKSQVVDGVA